MKKWFLRTYLILVPGLMISCFSNEIDFEDVTQENNIDVQTLLELVNDARTTGTTCGSTYYPPVNELVANEKLEAAALAHSQDMMENDFFSHTSSNGDALTNRLADVDYSYLAAAENIAWGYTSEESVMAGWLTSEGHCANIMNSAFTEMGVARVGNYWTQVFGKPQE
ncbi:CAP domain-containing protein [Labilibaculum sp.]|uniref:CAP domain-containing protein n=1 Tax=Labilibaculum sp. TaxID=2060723 RepID=UPI003568D08C